jgi:hypothetical protein
MKSYIAIIAVVLFLIGFSTKSFSQNDRVESLRVAFITEQLQLTPDESQKFWPVYNQYRGELKSLRQAYRLDAASEDDSQLADKKFEFEQKKLDLMKKYRPQIEQVVGAKKFGLLISAEDKFKQELLKRIQDKKSGK